MNDKYYSKALALIPIGRENAIPMRTIASALGVNAREVRQAILDARLDGVIICSGMYGYYYPDTDTDILHYYKRTRSRALKTLASLKATRQRVKEIEEENNG